MTGIVLPSTLRHRPMRPDDAQRWADLLDAVEAADKLGESFDLEDCEEELGEPETDYATNSIMVLDGERAVAYQVLRERTNAERRDLHSDARVHPDYRGQGIGTGLIAIAKQRGAELGRTVGLRIPESVGDAVTLAESSGFHPVRWFSLLTRDMAVPVQAVAPPEGLHLELLGPEFDAARWNEPLRAVRNAAFADHWGSAAVSAEVFAHSNTGTRSFVPGCSVAASTSDGTVVGLVISYEFAADTARAGYRDLYVATVATVREFRGRGLAAAMLAAVLEQGVAAGYARSSLDVDAANPTGALGLYERAGYGLKSRAVVYTDEAS